MHQILFKAFVWKQQVIYLQIFLLEQGDKPEKRYGWCKNGGVATFLLLYTAVQSHLLCVWGESKVPFLPFGSSVF